ncbi:hypothetical protein [Plasmodium yoelii yoelii]|uniref:Uncharacterized protein n=1 Tax=Plasmodium yoelii yoelii TaxID=73239 RepID=Q7R726_PLAYO|nr:hypothetical protein [Plasmodium yoelii yoelii]
MLAQHQTVLTAQILRIHALVVDEVLEQTVDMDAGLMGEHGLADDALVRGHRPAGGGRHQSGNLREMIDGDAGIDAIELVQSHHGFLDGRVTGPLPQSVDRGVHMARPGLHRHQGVGRRQAEVVVGVHLDFQIGGHGQPADALEGGHRLQQAQGVGEADPPGAGPLRRLCDLQHEVGIGAGGILTPDTDLQTGVQPPLHETVDAGQHPFAGPVHLVAEMDVRYRDRQVHPIGAAIGGRRQIPLAHPTPDHQPGR